MQLLLLAYLSQRVKQIYWEGEIIVDIFKKYGFENNIQIWSTEWISNNGKVEYSSIVAKCLKCYLQANMFAQIPVSYAEHDNIPVIL